MKSILIVAFFFILNITNLIAAEAGMPRLDPKYWLSQSFWLVLIFVLLYLSISKFFIPKIKDNLDNRENKIDGDLNEAKNLNELSEKKAREYENEINKAKKDVTRLLTESKINLDKSIEKKKNIFENEINSEISKAEKEIYNLKKNSHSSISLMAEEISSNIIEKITGDKLNQSSIKASIEEISKNKIKL